MWKYIGQGVDGLTGVPARDLTDEEFIMYSSKINGQFPTQVGALAACGLYEQVVETKASSATVSTPIPPVKLDEPAKEEDVT